MSIYTNYECTPIPIRDFDWHATFDNYDGAPDGGHPIGAGRTKKEAVEGLIDLAYGNIYSQEEIGKLLLDEKDNEVLQIVKEWFIKNGEEQ